MRYRPRLLQAIACTWATAMLLGCPFHAATPVARVHRGPAYREPVDPLAAMPIECVSEGSRDLCLPEYRAALATTTRMALELGGHELVDVELLNAETRRRTTKIIETGGEPRFLEERSGPDFVDLRPDTQRELLASIGVRGVLHGKVTMGAPRGPAQQRTITVAIRVTKLDDTTLAWRSSCSVETGDHHATEHAIDLAARCALESESLW